MKDNYLANLEVNGQKFHYYDIVSLAQEFDINLDKLPNSLKVLLENLLRNYDGINVTKNDFIAIKKWLDNPTANTEISFSPTRVLMQDFTGVPAVVDLAAMRDAVQQLGDNPEKINPLNNVDLVIDHSVQVDKYASSNAFEENVELEMERNKERYEFLKWGQRAFKNFKVVPPGTGICHQVNLEYLAKVIWQQKINDKTFLYPDSVVGTDSHTTMINGLSVLGWGVGGIEAEAAMLGQPISMLIPEVVGFKLTGKLAEGITATDLVLTVTKMLREKGVVGKFVEFYGEGLNNLTLADRATIANMAPEYGATCGFFPVDDETLKYMELTGRDNIEQVRAYCQQQKLWRYHHEPIFSDKLELDVTSVEPSLSGPKRPQDKLLVKNLKQASKKIISEQTKSEPPFERNFDVPNADYKLAHGDIVIAAITSCTNTSNPYVMIAAGLVAKKAVELGLKVKPWVKTSLAPGSKVVSDYLEKANLQTYLDQAGFNLVGYGCTTCIGNSGPLLPEIEETITNNKIHCCSILSGNRNFEGRVHPLVQSNYLASPPLVVAYAFAGTTDINLLEEAIAENKEGKKIYLQDIWPSNKEITEIVQQTVTRESFIRKYKDVFNGDKYWQQISSSNSITYNWSDSTYINNPPYFKDMQIATTPVKDINNAKIIAILGDSVTTDHISPAGNIAANSPAAKYLRDKNVVPADFNSYGSRRGNHEIMMRGTFANIRIRNEMLDNVEGGYTLDPQTNEVVSIYDAAMKHKNSNTPLVVVAGKEYGTGSSRDWAAKGTRLLGINAVIAESFERIHRSNLIGMGVLPLMFVDGENRKTLNLTGHETFNLLGIDNLAVAKRIQAEITYQDGKIKPIELLCRIDTATELEYYLNDGILPYMIRHLLKD